MGKINVGIFPCVSTNALSIRNCLKDHVNFNVIGMASGYEEFCLRHYDNYIQLPKLRDHRDIPEFSAAMKEQAKKNHLDFVFPTHDTIVDLFRSAMEETSQTTTCKNPTSYVLSHHTDDKSDEFREISWRGHAVCRNKATVYKLLGRNSEIPLPKVYRYTSETSYPYWIRPRVGQGGQGAHMVSKFTDLSQREAREFHTEYIATEYIDGPEYTVDCFSNGNKLIFAGARRREKIVSGVAYENSIMRHDSSEQLECERIAEEINKMFSFDGLWFFQCKERISNRTKQCDLLVTEVSARASSNVGLWRYFGFNLPASTVYQSLGRDVRFIDLRETLLDEKGSTFIRSSCDRITRTFDNYTDAWFDMDDTLFMKDNGKPNPKILALAYQMKNRNKHVHLITRRQGFMLADLRELLASYSISETLFDTMTIVSTGKSKASIINGGFRESIPILIDNSFYERNEAHMELGLPVFDIDCIDYLFETKY